MPLFLCTDPCRGSMPLRQRTGRAAGSPIVRTRIKKAAAKAACGRVLI